MRSALLTALRNRFSVVTAVAWALAAAAVYVFTGEFALVAGLTALFLFTEVIDVARDVPDIDDRYLKGGFGVVLLLVSVSWLRFDPTASEAVNAWAPVLGLLGGGWVLLDTRADFVQDRRLGSSEKFEELDAGEAMLRMQHVRLVVEELQEEPKTVAELAEACDLTPSRVSEAIEFGGHDGLVYPVDPDRADPRYAVDRDRIGLAGFGHQAASGLSGIARRFVRPFVDQF